MYTETEGIILKQIRISGGRRMLVLFSKRYGKISAGTSIGERGRNQAALSLRPFTHGRYEINRSGENYHINGGQVLSSHYAIGEDVEKYLFASYAMEVTEKLLQEDCPAPEIFVLFADFLSLIEERSKKHETLVIAYLLKLLKHGGCAPQLSACILCGEKTDLDYFHIPEGGLLCSRCHHSGGANERLIYPMEFAIVKVLRYILENPLQRLEGLALDEGTSRRLMEFLRDYLACHLDISGLKSEEFTRVL